MKVSVIGGGYVGLVSAAGLAEVGHQVTCMDVDAERVEQLRAGVIPIYEPGLAEMVQRNQKEARLQFTTSIGQAVLNA
ncbi:MAG: NAD-binding protein, partial [Xanthomonadales bacterium]|nr:NAD-binding protein [Xanthomonadales bacterium]